MQQDLGNALAYNYDLLYAILNAYKSVNAFKEITLMLKPLAAVRLRITFLLSNN
jgi:hypothetical protein